MKKRAYTLLELSIVITIVAILATGGLAISTSGTIQKKEQITKQRIAEIYKKLGQFVIQNGRMPCPASPQLAKNSTTYGTEVDCSNQSPASSIGIWHSKWTYDYVWYGMIPTRTLGLPSEMAEDAFGTKFGYFIVKGFTNAGTFGASANSGLSTNCSFTGCSSTIGLALNEVLSTSLTAGTTLKNISDQGMFAIISYGANKYGGWPSNGTTQNSASTDNSESFNYLVPGSTDSPTNGSANVYKYTASSTSDISLVVKDYASDIFDDIVFYKTRNEMVADFNFYNLITCSTQSGFSKMYGAYVFDSIILAAYYNTATIGYYDKVSPSANFCSSDFNKTLGPYYPTIRCGALGIWDTYLINDCQR